MEKCHIAVLVAVSTLFVGIVLAQEVAPLPEGSAEPGLALRAASMFGDHMVLQRDMPIPVWGSAKPGETVTVSFAGQKVSVKADSSGKWKVELPELNASAEGREMVIEGETKIVFNDVLVGEVWVCSGQSNMQYGWGKTSLPMYNWGGVPELEALVEDAGKRPIRSYNVPCNVSFTPNAECNGEWSTNVSGSAVAFGFSYYLQKQLIDVPVAVIVTCWGSSSIEGWMPLDMTEQLPHFKTMMDTFQNSEQAQTRVREAMAKGIRHGFVFVRKQPNLLYNAMLHPVIPYACRGMVWYQGEANAGKPEEYAQSLPLWIKRLRKEWGQDDLNFLIVMLPGFGTDDGRPDSKSWASFRDVQMKAVGLPHTHVVNTIDLGDAENIHPSDKEPICKRLGLMAACYVNGVKITPEGPSYKDFTVKGRQMTIEVYHGEGLKTTDGKAPRAFWLSGKDGKWYPAKGFIDGEQIVLESEELAEPAACRYAYCGKPDVNLVNGADLPAYPFKTDD